MVFWSPQRDTDLPQQGCAGWIGRSAVRRQQQHGTGGGCISRLPTQHRPPHPQSSGLASTACTDSDTTVSQTATLPASLIRPCITRILHMSRRLPAILSRALSADHPDESTETIRESGDHEVIVAQGTLHVKRNSWSSDNLST